MEETILIKQYNKAEIPYINLKEVWRYAGYKGIPDLSQEELNRQLQEAIEIVDKEVVYKVVYLKTNQVPFEHSSKDLENVLKGCESYYMFAATLGVGIDRQIAINSRISPVKALLLQALGAERVEMLCDKFCEDIEGNEAKDEKVLTMRFSPGYGDLPLEIQKDFFRILDCNRKIGISLNASLLMSPSKSVTAILGIKKSKDKTTRKDWCVHKCENCPNVNCEYRG